MKQLHSTTRMSLIIALLLVINAVCIFAYRDAVLTCETRKDSILNFTIRYETLANSLRSDATLYRGTGDDSFLDSFDQAIEQYYAEDAVDLGYEMSTSIQSPQELVQTADEEPISLESQLSYLEMNPMETDLYMQFHQQYSQLLDYLKDGRAAEDFSMLHTTEFESMYEDQANSIGQLNQQYINRINEQEAKIIRNQNIMEITLIGLSLLLLFITIFTFRLLKQKNSDNSYFRKLYTTVVENMNAGLSIVNESGRYEYINPKYLKLLDIENSDYEGKTAEDLFPPQVSRLLNTQCESAAEGHLNLEIHGEQHHMDYSHFIIFDENNQKMYVDLIHDRTETEQMQQQLRTQLREIEMYSRAKDAFLANISHEIKTPINAIVGMTHFLKQSGLTARQQDIVGKVEASSDVLLSIINDVLDFSKIKAQSLHLYPTAFHLDSLLKNLEDMFVSQIQAKGLDFEAHYDIPDHLALYMDRTRLLQIFVNLMGNACKFTNTGSISMTAHTKEETDEYINLEFCIEDTGIGIEEDDMSRLFLAFEQAENHLTKKHEGTGLGLPICKHIVDAMGGTMRVDSTPQKGSRFSFTIPCRKASEEAQEALKQKLSPSSGCFNGHGAHVLVVEDTEINMEIVTKLLQDANIICHTAKDGAEAVRLCGKYASNFFRLILMDIHMPIMDGYTAAKIIKDDLMIESPILALTATSMEEAASQQNGSLMDGYILKPFKIEEFYAAIQPFFPQADDPYGGSEEAIHNLGGMKSLYYKHVSRFKGSYGGSTQEIRSLLKEENYAEAKRTAHTIKGLSGTLGMPSLHEAAATLVMDIVNRSSELEDSILRFDTALQDVLETEPVGFEVPPVA